MNRRTFFSKTGTICLGAAALACSTVATAAIPRTKKIIHVAVGDENWEPTREELDAVLTSFQSVELEPLGGYVVTRSGIQVTTIDV